MIFVIKKISKVRFNFQNHLNLFIRIVDSRFVVLGVNTGLRVGRLSPFAGGLGVEEVEGGRGVNRGASCFPTFEPPFLLESNRK